MHDEVKGDNNMMKAQRKDKRTRNSTVMKDRTREVINSREITETGNQFLAFYNSNLVSVITETLLKFPCQCNKLAGVKHESCIMGNICFT